MPKYLIVPEIVPFKEESLTERGERVYTTVKIELLYCGGVRHERVLKADAGLGFTEEWIEDTIRLALEALEKDYPNEVYKEVRVKPNYIRFEYVGPKGMVN
jgi:hypothetical protein